MRKAKVLRREVFKPERGIKNRVHRFIEITEGGGVIYLNTQTTRTGLKRTPMPTNFIVARTYELEGYHPTTQIFAVDEKENYLSWAPITTVDTRDYAKALETLDIELVPEPDLAQGD